MHPFLPLIHGNRQVHTEKMVALVSKLELIRDVPLKIIFPKRLRRYIVFSSCLEFRNSVHFLVGFNREKLSKQIAK